jgi:hypothetical protein
MEARTTFIIFSKNKHENMSFSFICFLYEYIWKKIRNLWVNNNKNTVQIFVSPNVNLYTSIKYFLLLQMIIIVDNMHLFMIMVYHKSISWW